MFTFRYPKLLFRISEIVISDIQNNERRTATARQNSQRVCICCEILTLAQLSLSALRACNMTCRSLMMIINDVNESEGPWVK